MLYSTILALHIAAALVTILVIGSSLYALVLNKQHWYKRLSIALAVVAMLQILSGIMMIALNPELSAVKVGLHLLLYLSVCLVVEGALHLKARTAAWIS